MLRSVLLCSAIILLSAYVMAKVIPGEDWKEDFDEQGDGITLIADEIHESASSTATLDKADYTCTVKLFNKHKHYLYTAETTSNSPQHKVIRAATLFSSF